MCPCHLSLIGARGETEFPLGRKLIYFLNTLEEYNILATIGEMTCLYEGECWYKMTYDNTTQYPPQVSLKVHHPSLTLPKFPTSKQNNIISNVRKTKVQKNKIDHK